MPEELKMRVLLPASEIPERANVTKPGGSKIYQVLDEIRIIVGDGNVTSIKAEAGTRLLTSDNNGTFLSVPNAQVLAWIILESDLLDWLTDRQEERESK